MEKEKFEKLVKQAWNSLPSLFRKNVENLVIMVKEEPDEEGKKLVRGGGTILGYYRGIPLRHRGSYYAGVSPDTIVIFKKPIESICKDEDEIRWKVKEVLFHEIGHYFGFNESDLRRMGWG